MKILFFILLLSGRAFCATWQEFDNLTVRTGLTVNVLEIGIEDKNNIGQKLSLSPNVPTKLFFSGAYKWAGASYGFSANTTDKDNELKGKSSQTDWQFRFNFARFSVDAYYQQYKGYYLSNTDKFQSQPVGSPYIQYPDLNLEHAGIGFTWVLNPDDNSLSAAFDQSARQTQSGWSFLLSSNLSHHRFTTPTSLIPVSATGSFGAFENIRGSYLYAVNIGGGVVGTFVPYGNWFLTGALVVRVGEEFQKIESVSSTSQNTKNNSQADFRAAFGYNGDRFLSGISIQGNSVSYNLENAKVNFGTTNGLFFIGTRFL